LSNGPAIYAATGMRYLWFMPALFSFAVIKAVAMRWPAFGKGLTILAWFWMLGAALIMPRIPYSVPWGIESALFFFGLGQAATYAVSRLSLQAGYQNGIAAASAVAALSAMIIVIPLGWVAAAGVDTYDIRQPATWLVGVCYPCVMLAALYCLGESGPFPAGRLLGRLLAALGRRSLPVYLVHVPVYRVLTLAWFGGKFDDVQVVGPEWGVGLLILALSTAFSLGLSAAVWSAPFLRRSFFPRAWEDWYGGLLDRGV
jgi:peptidoglycan/LPS O-acetylase OafA/YrhL